MWYGKESDKNWHCGRNSIEIIAEHLRRLTEVEYFVYNGDSLNFIILFHYN